MGEEQDFEVAVRPDYRRNDSEGRLLLPAFFRFQTLPLFSAVAASPSQQFRHKIRPEGRQAGAGRTADRAMKLP